MKPQHHSTSSATNNQIVVKNNIFDNAGAIYLQTQANFTGNTIKMINLSTISKQKEVSDSLSTSRKYFPVRAQTI